MLSGQGRLGIRANVQAEMLSRYLESRNFQDQSGREVCEAGPPAFGAQHVVGLQGFTQLRGFVNHAPGTDTVRNTVRSEAQVGSIVCLVRGRGLNRPI